MENHELTKTTARIRVLVDGLKPLLKESIIEFDSGEDTLITLKYEKLEMHCSLCASLLHTRKNCPEKAREYSGDSQLIRIQTVTKHDRWEPTRKLKDAEFRITSEVHHQEQDRKVSMETLQGS